MRENECKKKSRTRNDKNMNSHTRTSNHFSNYTFNLNINGMLNHNRIILRAVLLIRNWIWPEATDKKYMRKCMPLLSLPPLRYKFWIPKLSDSHSRLKWDFTNLIVIFFSMCSKKCVWFFAIPNVRTIRTVRVRKSQRPTNKKNKC